MVRHGDNELRYRASEKGHVESWFMRANHPTERKAVWLKATIRAPTSGGSPPTADAWFIYFDGDADRTSAHRQTIPLEAALFDTRRPAGHIEVGEAVFSLGGAGGATGAAKDEHGTCRWDLSWKDHGGVLGAPLSMFPYEAMVDGPFPRSKLLTPHPVLVFDGTIDVDAETIDVSSWLGMQGHNWGREHAYEYAWGQCVFVDGAGRPEAMMEAFTSRIRIAGRTTPRMSALVVRRGTRTFAFDTTFDFWRQDATIDDMRWTLRLAGAAGEASLEMVADPREMVCLGYDNPDGRLSYCFNSKLARTVLRVNPHDADGFECTSEHGGALEFLRNEPDARFDRVV